jgi:signal transduction histidine kinase
MILDVLRSRIPESAEDPIEWDALYHEVDDVQTFSNRLDLIIDPLPPIQSLPLSDVLAEAQSFFAQRFPLCSLEMTGEPSNTEFSGANWLGIILRELLANAGHAAGRDGNGVVEVAWTTDPGLQVVVANSGAKFPAEIPVDPPVPFCSTAPSYDGLGLSIVYRICLALGMTMTVRTDLEDMTAVIIG